MKIAEVFYSIQGEGKLMGLPSVFVRISGCNLRCTWCDTPYASWQPEGREMGVDEIVRQAKTYGARHAVVTGGEPMIFPEVAPLCDLLRRESMHVTLETAATTYRPVRVDLASLSPKLSNSTPWQRDGGRFAAAHEKARINRPVIQQFIDSSATYQLKFVICTEKDVAEMEELLGSLRRWSPPDVLLMPEGTDVPTLRERGIWLAEVCKRKGYRFCPRMHIELYGNRRGV